MFVFYIKLFLTTTVDKIRYGPDKLFQTDLTNTV